MAARSSSSYGERIVGSKHNKQQRADSGGLDREELVTSLKQYVADLSNIKHQLKEFQQGLHWPKLIEQLMKKGSVSRSRHERAHSRKLCNQTVDLRSSPSVQRLTYRRHEEGAAGKCFSGCPRARISYSRPPLQNSPTLCPASASGQRGIKRSLILQQQVLPPTQVPQASRIPRVQQGLHGEVKNVGSRRKTESREWGSKNAKSISATIQKEERRLMRKLRRYRNVLNQTEISLRLSQMSAEDSLIAIYAHKPLQDYYHQAKLQSTRTGPHSLQFPFALFHRPNLRLTTRVKTSIRTQRIPNPACNSDSPFQAPSDIIDVLPS